jgi:hypothetical protein
MRKELSFGNGVADGSNRPARPLDSRISPFSNEDAEGTLAYGGHSAGMHAQWNADANPIQRENQDIRHALRDCQIEREPARRDGVTRR